KRGATNKIDAADKEWLYFTFDSPETATDLEGISGPGDSGGPALIQVNGKLYIAGVSVWGNPGKNGRGTYGAREGYTRVSSYYDWITGILSGKPQERAETQSVERLAGNQSANQIRPPDTPAGQIVAAYIKAFNSGNEQVMRDFFANNVAKAALERRSINERI